MAASNHELPPLAPRSALISGLRQMVDEQEVFLQDAIPPDRVPTNAEDHLVIAALRRSLDNTRGILAMADQENVFCGMPIVRFQFDTAMCLFARTLVADIHDFVAHIMKGGRLRHYRDRDGQRLFDAYLHEKLSEKHPHTSDCYEETSQYIHFSTQHLHRVLDLERYGQTQEVILQQIDENTVGWPDEQIRGVLTRSSTSRINYKRALNSL